MTYSLTRQALLSARDPDDRAPFRDADARGRSVSTIDWFDTLAADGAFQSADLFADLLARGVDDRVIRALARCRKSLGIPWTHRITPELRDALRQAATARRVERMQELARMAPERSARMAQERAQREAEKVARAAEVAEQSQENGRGD